MGDIIAQLDDLADAFVTKGKWTTERSFAANNEEVEIASSDGEGPHEGLVGTRDGRLPNFLPFEPPGRNESELTNLGALLVADPMVDWQAPVRSRPGMRSGSCSWPPSALEADRYSIGYNKARLERASSGQTPGSRESFAGAEPTLSSITYPCFAWS